eukprot:TRINITY_DN47891_c0_g1_i1.p1 TRINITY_DN47891_c0_g1~~TRINITY_DN47891_c0_g1_i1.p1  ORF type:complete len:567 (+),score=127.41 TRINITY_DN47891_c0_g1_i1:111-1811(+)
MRLVPAVESRNRSTSHTRYTPRSWTWSKNSGESDEDGGVRDLVEVVPQRSDELESASEWDIGDEDSSWDLILEQSIYSRSLLAPLIQESKTGCCTKRAVWFSTVMLLLLNMSLQFVILVKVQRLTDENNAEVHDKLFGAFGLCARRSARSLPFKPLLGDKLDEYFDCGPLTPSIVANLQLLDEDGDGFWELPEASNVEDAWHVKYQKLVQLKRLLRKLLEMARAGRLAAQRGSDVSTWKAATQNFTVLPMGWIAAQQGDLDLCAVTDERLCGNLEVRGILQAKLRGITEKDDRISKCADIVGNWCPEIFGEVFKSYTAWGKELCGSPNALWDSQRELRTVEFREADRYSSRQREEGVNTWMFRSFVLLILMIWWMTIFTEWREILDWWIVLFLIPSHPPVLLHDDGKIEILCVPMCLKCVTIFLNVLPRTVIGLATVYCGSNFLVSSDNYMDLILNSVALAFLIQIDEMLHSALVAKREKQDLEDCMPIQVRHPCFALLDKCSTCLPFPLVSASFVLGCCIATLWDAYTKKGGKNDMGFGLSCLCHVEGTYCLAAQLLGGRDTLNG